MSSDFVTTATEEEMQRVEQFWGNARASANEFGATPGVVDGGRWAVVKGLQSEAGKKLNGKVGQIQEEEPNDEGRLQVTIDRVRGVKLIKTENLVDVPQDELVKTYRIPANGERGVAKHQVILFPKQHSMFHTCNPRGNAPAMALCGLPLVVAKTKARKKLVEQADYDNQWATWLMIDPLSGFAPPRWQSFVGPVLVYRPCGEHFSSDDMDVTNEFLSALLDMFGEGPDFDPTTWLNPSFFQRFIRCKKAERREGNYGSRLDHLNIIDT